MSQIPILVAYMDWEMDPKAKASGTQGPVIDAALIRSVTERTVAAYSLAASLSPSETQALLKDGEASIWSRYIAWLQSTHKEATEIAMRATRACPQSPSLWGLLLHEMVSRWGVLALTARNVDKARQVICRTRLIVLKTSERCLRRGQRHSSRSLLLALLSSLGC
jgi:hypothetical protein